jgi:FkbM family methyltransferase
MDYPRFSRLRCELPVPAGTRRGRVPIQLRQTGPDSLAILPPLAPGDVTHQLVCVGGVPFITHLPHLDATLSGEIARTSFWELAESFALIHALRPGHTFVDVGANLGYYSVLASHILQGRGMVCAVEPEPRNYLVLSANLLLTKLLFQQAAPAIVIPQALSDHSGNARLFLFDQNSGAHSLVAKQGAIDSVIVPCASLDALRFSTDSEPVIKRPIDVIKADIQGSELAMLKGAEKTLGQDRPLLVLEFEPYLLGPEVCLAALAWLRTHRYSLFRVFHANSQDPHGILAESVRILSSDEVAELVQKKMIGPYGSIIAYPDKDESEG